MEHDEDQKKEKRVNYVMFIIHQVQSLNEICHSDILIIISCETDGNKLHFAEN